MKKTFSIVLLCLFNYSLYAQLNTQTPEMVADALSDAFATRKIDPVRSYLSQRFSVGAYNKPAAEGMLQGILEKYTVDSLVLTGIETIDNKKRLQLHVIRNNKPAFTYAWLNDQNELLYVDLFDQLYGMNRYQPSVLKARIPFKLVNGSIVITATLNDTDRPLQLLFDTGADGMALRRSLADSLGLTVSREQNAAVVGGRMKIAISSGNTVHLDTLKLNNTNIALFEEIGHGYDGILGCTIATSYITRVDFDKQVIELFGFGTYEHGKDGNMVEITFPSGIPIIPVSMKVGEKEVAGDFVFDSGANYYLIAFGAFVKKHLLLTNGFVPYFTGATVSMGHTTTTFTGNFPYMKWGNTGMQDFPGVLQAHNDREENWVGSAGSFGIKSMRRYNFSIDLSKHIIHFTPNKYYDLPADFVLGKLVFSFNSLQQLVIAQVGEPKLMERFHEGDVVISIDGIKAEQLAKQPNKITELKSRSKKTYQLKLERNGRIDEEKL
ncbi:MAG TPA: retropepsin-like aspartic protease [Chitinophagaceae bacterium]|jgi:hypothetical protein|nr:retropepsin-like aspartic protease [Chitinophagaceae bacterium]